MFTSLDSLTLLGTHTKYKDALLSDEGGVTMMMVGVMKVMRGPPSPVGASRVGGSVLGLWPLKREDVQVYIWTNDA